MKTGLVRGIPGRITVKRGEFGINRWKTLLPFIAGGTMLIVVLLLSITVFIWALPVIIPLFIVWLIFRNTSNRR